jgi:hypothetical protein
VPGPSISSIQHTPEIVEEGGLVNFTIKYSNTDTQNSFTDAVLVVGYDQYLTFSSATPNVASESDVNQRKLIWQLGTLEPEQSGIITVEFQVENNFPITIYERGIHAQISGIGPNGSYTSGPRDSVTLILNHPTPTVLPTSTPQVTAAPEASQTLVQVAYIKRVDVGISGDDQGDLSGLALELVDNMFTNEKTYLGEADGADQAKIRSLLDKFFAGDYDLALGFPNNAIKEVEASGGLQQTDPYFCAETMAIKNNKLMAEVNENLSKWRQDGSLDSLITKYFNPQRSAEASKMETWAAGHDKLKDKKPHAFNPNGLSQFCTAVNYVRDALVSKQILSKPLELDVLRNLESSPEPDKEGAYIVTVPFVQTLKKGESGPLGVMLRSATPYDISPISIASVQSGGLLMPAIIVPQESNVVLIEWNDADHRFILTAANGSRTELTPIVLEDRSPSASQTTITYFEGSITICAWWNGYGGCATI